MASFFHVHVRVDLGQISGAQLLNAEINLQLLTPRLPVC